MSIARRCSSALESLAAPGTVLTVAAVASRQSRRRTLKTARLRHRVLATPPRAAVLAPRRRSIGGISYRFAAAPTVADAMQLVRARDAWHCKHHPKGSGSPFIELVSYSRPRRAPSSRTGPLAHTVHCSAARPLAERHLRGINVGVTRQERLSGRRDSDPRHRPWQGRALPG